MRKPFSGMLDDKATIPMSSHESRPMLAPVDEQQRETRRDIGRGAENPSWSL
jgi:hypothetical protein